MVRYLSQFFNV